MRSRTERELTNRCVRCYIQTGFCLCADVPRIDTPTRVTVIRHALEGWKTTNTARIALLALPNAELFEYGGPDARFDEAVLSGPDTWLLFPDGSDSPLPASPPQRLVVLDGTWPQARRMLQRINALRGLPRLSLPAPTQSRERLRQTALPEGRSTLEAIADALALIHNADAAERLHALHELMVRRVREVRASGGPRYESSPL